MFLHFTDSAELVMGQLVSGAGSSWLSSWGSVPVWPGSDKLGGWRKGRQEEGQKRWQRQAAALSSRYAHAYI